METTKSEKSTRRRVWRAPRRVGRWFMAQTPLVLITMLLVVGMTWAFVEIAGEVVEGDTQAFDRWMVLAMRQADDPSIPLGPPWVQELGRDATAFGGLGSLTMFTLVVAGYLYLNRERRMMVVLLLSVGGGLVISMLLKHFIDRPRPDFVPHLSHVYTSSFPSGHSMLSAVVFLTLGSLLSRVTKHWQIKIYWLAVAVLLSVLVGISRIYLGVHYPTDVLAGWLVGLSWALLCWLVAEQV